MVMPGFSSNRRSPRTPCASLGLSAPYSHVQAFSGFLIPPVLSWRRVLFPLLAPSVLSGFTLAFSRALGEYGSVVFIAGNMPLKTEVASLLIITKLEQFDYAGATAIAVTLLALSLLSLVLINLLQARTARHLGGA